MGGLAYVQPALGVHTPNMHFQNGRKLLFVM